MPDLTDLTDLQLAILGVLWSRGEATVADVHERLEGSTDVALKTIATLLSRLEKRGLVAHRTEARASVYRATVARRRVLLARVASLLGSVFQTPEASPAVAALDASEVAPGDADRVLALLQRLEEDVRTPS